MSKLFAIVQREFIERVRTKAFLIGTLIAPLMFAARNGNPMGFLRVLVFPDKKEMTFWFGDPND